jgi:hypothetical protein
VMRVGERRLSLADAVEEFVQLVRTHDGVVAYRPCFVDFSGFEGTMMVCAGRSQPDRA